MRLSTNSMAPRSLVFVVAIILVSITTLGNCHPTDLQQQRDDSLATTAEGELPSIALTNISRETDHEDSSSTGIWGLMPRGLPHGFSRRPELDQHHVCRKWYQFFFDNWIVQVPREWWEERWVSLCPPQPLSYIPSIRPYSTSHHPKYTIHRKLIIRIVILGC